MPYKIVTIRTKGKVIEMNKLKNSAGDNPYIFDCHRCGASKGCLCQDDKGNEYIDGSYHKARLMKDCLGVE